MSTGRPTDQAQAATIEVEHFHFSYPDGYEALHGVTVHHIRLLSERPIAFWDFRHADHLMAAGRSRTEAYLDGGGVMTKGD